MTATNKSSDDIRLKARRNFWQRQFGGQATSSQIAFDVMLGILLPLICFVADPGILKGDITEFAPLSLVAYKLFIYLMSGLAIFTLTLWLLFGQRIQLWAGSVGGILLTGAFCSFLIGIIILPLSFVGLMFIIGILGFTPFFTSFVYLRNGIRAIRRGHAYSSRALLIGSALLSSTFLIAAPGITQWRIHGVVEQSMQEIMSNDSGLTEAAVQRLKYLRWFADLDQIVLAYGKEIEPSRKARLARVYKEITGYNIEDRLAILRD